ncbi:MAG: hypothetical protein QOD10_69 [Mycobacterium sp.]|jgi:hypothetical protein|nr:hypothetical protein [Mycobacterium sp.]
MSHVTPAPLATSETEPGKHAPFTVTENQVAFSTAAAAAVSTTRRRWLDTTPMGGLGRILTALTQPRLLYPRRELAYFEAARMSRAMDRL